METSDHVRAQEQDSERSSTQELDGPDDQDGGVLDENSTLEETPSPQDDIPGESLQAPEEMRSESPQAQGQPGPERPSTFDSILSASESEGAPFKSVTSDSQRQRDQILLSLRVLFLMFPPFLPVLRKRSLVWNRASTRWIRNIASGSRTLLKRHARPGAINR